MKYVSVVITPEDEAALSNVVSDAMESDHPDADVAYKWIAYVRDRLYGAWQGLPDGSHLKSAYADDVWSWNDEDLVNPETPN